MKKIFSIIAIFSILISGVTMPAFSTENNHSQMVREQRKKEFEQRLNLTDKQKKKAKEIHEKGREQLKPIITQIEQNKQEMEKIKQSKMTQKAIDEKVDSLIQANRELEAKAREIRKENSKEFEKILNSKQKNELAIMKAEGRARFEKNHPPKAPFGNFNNPGFLAPQRLFQPVPPREMFK